MSKTFDDYVLLIQNDVDTTAVGDTEIIEQSIREAYQDILRDAYKYLVGTTTTDQAVTASTSGYTVSDGFLEVYKVYYKDSGDWSEVKPITEKEYLDEYINEDTGTPQRYYIKGVTVYTSPAPNTTGTLRIVYTAIPDELATGSTSLIPDRYTEVLRLGAVQHFLAFEKDPASEIYERRYMNAKDRMLKELTHKQELIRPKLWGRL